MTSTNPNEFWRKIQNLGPRKDKSVLIEIIDENGDVDLEVEIVFERWRRDFHELYNCSENDRFDETLINSRSAHVPLPQSGLLQQLKARYVAVCAGRGTL